MAPLTDRTTPLVLEGTGLTAADVTEAAHGRAGVTVARPARARARAAAARESAQRIAARRPVHG
ncbi:hypothetical protein ACFVFJ_38600 [Streptomyces sp. NPDC057717]|uniref:hypothetical protein n=1 Tax=unclassified Streptomyces TaxID=2593676 RepID=UPI003644581A